MARGWHSLSCSRSLTSFSREGEADLIRSEAHRLLFHQDLACWKDWWV